MTTLYVAVDIMKNEEPIILGLFPTIDSAKERCIWEYYNNTGTLKNEWHMIWRAKPSGIIIGNAPGDDNTYYKIEEFTI